MTSEAQQPWGRRRLIAELRAAVADPARIGDVPVLKSALSGQRASPAIEAQLGPVRGYHPPLDLTVLAALPASSFGAAYARFLQSNGLRPIVLSGRLPPELVAENAFVARYGTIHDMVHALLGFDASWPGEVGVWAFVGAQGYSPMFRLAGWAALLVAPVRCPLQLGRALRCWRAGRAMARGAKLLLTLRLEERLGDSLDEARAALGIVGARDDGWG